MITNFIKKKFRRKGQDSGGRRIHDADDRFIGGTDSGDDKIKY